MDQKTILLHQMNANHNEPNWFVPIENALIGLSEEDAKQKQGDSNSIFEIVYHLLFWNELYLNRLKGIPNERHIESNDESFDDVNNDDWETLKTKLYEVLNEWKSALQEMDEAKFEESANEDRHDPWYSKISNINIHNAYHIGQIVQIRKSQGNWDPENGVH